MEDNNQTPSPSLDVPSAAVNGRLNEVQNLIEAGADLNAKDADCMTALMYASMKGCTEIVRLLLSAGAEVDAKEDYGWTALLFAANYGYPEIVQLLLQAGADVGCLASTINSH